MVFAASPPGARLKGTAISVVPVVKKLTATPVVVAVAACEITIFGAPEMLDTVVLAGMPLPTTVWPFAIPVELVTTIVVVLFRFAVVDADCWPRVME